MFRILKILGLPRELVQLSHLLHATSLALTHNLQYQYDVKYRLYLKDQKTKVPKMSKSKYKWRYILGPTWHRNQPDYREPEQLKGSFATIRLGKSLQKGVRKDLRAQVWQHFGYLSWVTHLTSPNHLRITLSGPLPLLPGRSSSECRRYPPAKPQSSHLSPS